MTHKNYSHKRPEVFQAFAQQFFPDNSKEFHKTVETMYTMELSHPDLQRTDELYFSIKTLKYYFDDVSITFQ